MVPLMFAALRQSKNSREFLSRTSKINNYSLLNENKTKPFHRYSRLSFNNIIDNPRNSLQNIYIGTIVFEIGKSMPL